MPLTAGKKLGHYEVLSLLGQGGMGEVYRARDAKLKRDVAIKVLPETVARDRERLARFQREAEVLASLNHPNIAHIYGVEDRALVMELVEGESPKGPMPFEEAWKICSQIAEALDYAHDKGVVHRDLKPANVKVTPEGLVKLLDFGLAKAFCETPDSAPSDPANSPTVTLGATVAGTIMGTAAYMAPEQARGKKVDKRADIWSFGVVLYELIAGGRAFKGDDITEILASVVKEQPDLTLVPVEVRRLLAKCLEKDPKLRLRDIGDAWELLGTTTAVLETAPSRSRFGLAGWAVAAFAFLVATSLAFLYFHPTPLTSAGLMRFEIPVPDNLRLAPSGVVSLSPDGRKLAFLAAGPDGVQRIWVRMLDSLEVRMLEGTQVPNSPPPFWSPDSRFIAFDTDAN
jgi:serine/threonine protein kinase